MRFDTEVAIIGSGFSGLGMAIKCTEAGRPFIACETGPSIGGTYTEGIDRMTPTSIVTADGREHDVDVIIYATGFKVSDVLGRTEIVGLGQETLGDVWRDRLSAYLSSTITGFPDFFMLLGPNTGLGHNSMVFMIESQVHDAIECMKQCDRRNAQYLDVRPAEQLQFNESLTPRLARSIWATGCNSWYLDAGGHNFSAWPGPTFEFWWRTRRPVAAHYNFVGKRQKPRYLRSVLARAKVAS